MPVDHKAIVELARCLTTPVDTHALVAQGVLRCRGRWFQVLDPARFPAWARGQITAMRAGPDGLLVLLRRRNRPAEVLYEELTREESRGETLPR